MDLCEILQFIILETVALSFCLSPILTVPILKKGTSEMPLEELPTTPSTIFNKKDRFDFPKI